MILIRCRALPRYPRGLLSRFAAKRRTSREKRATAGWVTTLCHVSGAVPPSWRAFLLDALYLSRLGQALFQLRAAAWLCAWKPLPQVRSGGDIAR